MEQIHYADLSNRVATEIKRLENQISNDIHKDILLIAYEKTSHPEEVQND